MAAVVRPREFTDNPHSINRSKERHPVNPGVGNSPLVDLALKANYPYGEWFDRIFKGIIAAMDIGKAETVNPTYTNVGDFVQGAKTMLSVMRGISMLIKIFSGSLTHEYVEVPVKYNPETKTYDEVDSPDKASFVRNSDGTYSPDYKKVVKKRDWMDIVLDVVLMVARFLNPILWLNKMKVLDLGKHAGWMGNTVGCAFTAVTAISFIQSLRDLGNALSDNVDTARLRKRVADVISNFADVLSIPFDCGWSFSASKGGALASAICGLVSAFLWIFKESL